MIEERETVASVKKKKKMFTRYCRFVHVTPDSV